MMLTVKELLLCRAKNLVCFWAQRLYFHLYDTTSPRPLCTEFAAHVLFFYPKLLNFHKFIEYILRISFTSLVMNSSDSFTNLEFQINYFFNEYLRWFLLQVRKKNCFGPIRRLFSFWSSSYVCMFLHFISKSFTYLLNFWRCQSVDKINNCK